MAAKALEQQFRQLDGVEAVQRMDVLEATNDVYRAFYDDAYFTLVRATPWLVGWGYDANDPPFKLGSSVSLWDRINTTDTVRAIHRFRPTTIVGTHFLPLRLVALLLERGSLHCTLSAVTTDYDFQGLWLTGAFNRFYVARQETKDHLAAIGVPEDRLVVSGIPVRVGLDDPIDSARIHRRYGLREEVPTLLISAGASGGRYITNIVQQVLRMRNPCQAVVVCGRNEELRADIQRLVHGSDRFAVLGYTTDMADLMRAATLFVGKPGGLSSSECMAAGLPMVLINPIPGQEVRNSDFLLEEGAAVRCNYETTVGSKMDRLLDHPTRLAAMAGNARRIGRPDAARQIAGSVLADDTQPLWISHAAQRAVLAASEHGRSAADVHGPQRLRPLLSLRAGAPVALITQTEVGVVEMIADTSSAGAARLYITMKRLVKLRHRHPEHADLLLLLRHLIGPHHEIALTVGP